MKLVVVGDLHLDCAKVGRNNPATDIDLRVEDFIGALDKAIYHAIEIKADIFIINGDLFKGRTSSHIIETIVAQRIKLIRQNMRLIIVLGNHDYTPRGLEYGIHAYSIFEKFDVEIYTDLSHITTDDTDLVIYPYYDARRTKLRNDEFIAAMTTRLDSFTLTKPCKLFIGHGTPIGTIFHQNTSCDLNQVDEPILPASWFDRFDMALFSHIHRSQRIGAKIFHIGSIERAKFDEADADKGFVVYDTQTKTLKFVSTNPRPMYNLSLDLLNFSIDKDINQQIIDSFINLPNLNSAILKLSVSCTQQAKATIDYLRLKQSLDQTFHYDWPIRINTPRTEIARMKEVTEQLLPIEALERVVASRDDLTDDEKRHILIRGRGILARET